MASRISAAPRRAAGFRLNRQQAQERVRTAEPGGSRLVIAAGQGKRRGAHPLAGVRAPGGRRHVPQAAQQCLPAVWIEQPADRQLVDDHPRGDRTVADVRGIAHRVRQLSMPAMPSGGAPQQFGEQIRVLLPEPGAEGVTEERMIAVPAIARGPDEQAGRGELSQPEPRTVLIRQLQGQVLRDPLGDAGAQQDVPHPGGVRFERLAEKVTADQLVGLTGIGRLFAAQRDRHETKPGHPALGVLNQRHERFPLARHVAAAQQFNGLGAGKGQVPGMYLGKVPREAELVQWQRLVHAGAGHHAQSRFGVSQQVAESGESLGRAHRMQVVQHQNRGRLQRGQRGREQERRVPIIVETLRRHLDTGPGEGGRQVIPEVADGIVVFVQRQPGNRAGPPAGRQPVRQSHRLTRSRRPGDKGHRSPAEAFIDKPVDSRARYDPGGQWRWRYLAHKKLIRNT